MIYSSKFLKMIVDLNAIYESQILEILSGIYAFNQIEDEINYVSEMDIKDFNPVISYSLNGKNYSAKIGKVIRNLFKKYQSVFGYNMPSDKDLEQFVNQVKAYITHSSLRFVTVSEENIRKYYSKENHVMTINGGGTLGSNCMNNPYQGKFLDLYVYNNNCSLLILFDDNLSKDKIVGRCLCWKYKDNVYVDKLYYCTDFYKTSMLNYIKNLNYNYRVRDKNNTDDPSFFMVNGEFKDDVEISFKYSKCPETFPFCDTMEFFDPYTLTLSNYPSPGAYRLHRKDGGYIAPENWEDEIYFENGETLGTCQYCGELIKHSQGIEIPEGFVCLEHIDYDDKDFIDLKENIKIVDGVRISKNQINHLKSLSMKTG